MALQPIIHIDQDVWVDIAPGRRQLRYAAGSNIPLAEAVAAGIVSDDQADTLRDVLPQIDDGTTQLGQPEVGITEPTADDEGESDDEGDDTVAVELEADDEGE